MAHTSYHNEQKSNNIYDDNDLYEYDGNESKGIGGTVKNFLGSVQLKSSEDDTHSIHQYKRDVIDSLCSQINQTLLIPKAFYFFFFAAFGSLFPLMAIYFKQMAMSPVQVGILFGFRPFVEFLSVPFWANLGEKWKKGKLILIGSLFCWIFFTLGVGFIKPPVHSCLMHNETHIFLEKSKTGLNTGPASNRIVSGGHNVVYKRSIELENIDNNNYINNKNDEVKDTFGLSLRKKRDERLNYINITKIIKIKKTKSTTTTESTTKFPTTFTTTNTPKSKKTKKTTIKTTEQVDEIDFEIPNKKETSTVKSVLIEAIDKVSNEIVDRTKIDNNKSDKKGENFDSTNVFKDQIDKTVEDTKKINFIKTTLSSSTTTTTIKNDVIKTVEKTHYFDPDPLDSSKTRSKIVYLNDSTLRLVKPSLQTSIVYHKNDVHKIFLVFLIFILAGEFFSAPAITLADTVTLQYLGPSRADLYGRQRMFGSLGWALAMFSVGLLLDNSKAFTDHPCGKAGPDERNYTVCFAIYSVLMGCALVVATQLKFNYGGEQIPLKAMTQSIKKQVNKVRGEKYQQFDRKRFVDEPSDDENINDRFEIQNESNNSNQPNNNLDMSVNIESDVGMKSKLQRLYETCKTSKLLLFLFVVWFMGIGVGLVFTFLFWHLQDLGGSPSLYGIASVINHMSELMAYFFVHQIVRQYGHIKIFYAGLLGNGIRFIYVSILSEPYWILPFEFIQGVTHALVWATATSYFTQAVPEDLRSSAQGILQGIHFGLGRGCGAVLGGLFITSFGTKVTFAVYGVLCFALMIAYITLNNYILNNVAKQNPNYTQNTMLNEENFDNPNTVYNPNFDSSQIPEINNVANPNLFDSNFYYQASSSNQNNSQFNSTSKSSFPIAPHGVPSTNPNWTKQFVDKRNY